MKLRPSGFQKAAFGAWVQFRTSDKVRQIYDRRAERYRTREAASGYANERRQFRLVHGYAFDPLNPVTFSQHMCAKKLFDRDPLLPVIADKYAVRGYVEEILGPNNLFPDLLYIGDDPEEVPFESWRGGYAAKCTHGSRMNVLVPPGADVDVSWVRQHLKLWMARQFGVTSNQWCYQPIKPRIIVERLLVDQNGKMPSDIKLQCFGGKVEAIQLINDRQMGRSTAMVTPEGDMIPYKTHLPMADNVTLPSRIDDMIDIAEKLSARFDYLRVDFYQVDGRIYLGELTNYSAAGRVKIRPYATEERLGALWPKVSYLPDTL